VEHGSAAFAQSNGQHLVIDPLTGIAKPPLDSVISVVESETREEVIHNLAREGLPPVPRAIQGQAGKEVAAQAANPAGRQPASHLWRNEEIDAGIRCSSHSAENFGKKSIDPAVFLKGVNHAIDDHPEGLAVIILRD
jgi:hypothetical protein